MQFDDILFIDNTEKKQPARKIVVNDVPNVILTGDDFKAAAALVMRFVDIGSPRPGELRQTPVQARDLRRRWGAPEEARKNDQGALAAVRWGAIWAFPESKGTMLFDKQSAAA